MALESGYTEEQEREQEQDAVMAGFESTDIKPVEPIAVEQNPTGNTPLAQEPDPSSEPKEEMAVLTKAQLNALNEKARKVDSFEERLNRVSSGVNGKIGSLIQQVESLKSSASGLSPKAKDRLAAEFPELAKIMFDEVEVGSQVEARSPVPQTPQIAEHYAEVLDQHQKTFERKLLNLAHNDWEPIVSSSEYAQWMDRFLTADERQAFEESWDAEHVGGRISEYKKYRGSLDAQRTGQASQAAAKQERLADAVTPRGLPRGAVAVSPEDEEEAAMLSAFNGRK